ncbi:MAG TPA: NUDIX hydrolase [Pyrinomonadaceae bacterium]|nr:NUDIX hydrolase [Pyrinomonadaceae bacterium]
MTKGRATTRRSEGRGTEERRDDAPLEWRPVRSEGVADCRVFKVRRDLSASPRDGRMHDFYVLEAPDWINVIPLTDDGRVVLIEQYRHGTREVSLEIPGGMVDEGESPAETAAREMLEETGYEAGALVSLGRARPNPAIQDNWIHTFLARGSRFRRAPVFQGTEQTRTLLVPVTEIPSLIADEQITHALVVLAFHKLWLHENGYLRGREL